MDLTELHALLVHPDAEQRLGALTGAMLALLQQHAVLAGRVDDQRRSQDRFFAKIDAFLDSAQSLQGDQSLPGRANLFPVSLSTSSGAILAANRSRRGFIAKNDGPARAYLAFAPSASTEHFTVDLDPGGIYVDRTRYTGEVSGVTAMGAANLFVTELVP